MKCKIFRHVFANDAENAINKWLSENKYNVYFMTQGNDHTGTLIITILYSEY